MMEQFLILKDWKQKYDVAATSILKRDDKIQQVAELIENDLFILGATAVEDKLQLVCFIQKIMIRHK